MNTGSSSEESTSVAVNEFDEGVNYDYSVGFKEHPNRTYFTNILFVSKFNEQFFN